MGTPAPGNGCYERRGGDPKTDRATQGAATQKPTYERRNSLKQLGREERGPKDLGVVAPLTFYKLSRQLLVAEVLFPSIVADLWFAVLSSIWACACLQRNAWFTLVHAMCHSTKFSPCLCGRAVLRSSQSWLQAVISPESAVQECVTLILPRTSLSRGLPA